MTNTWSTWNRCDGSSCWRIKNYPKKYQELSIEIKTQYRILLILMTADNLNPWISSVQPASAMLPLAYGLPTFSGHPTSSTLKKLVSCRVVSSTVPWLQRLHVQFRILQGAKDLCRLDCLWPQIIKGHEMTSIEDQNGYQNKLGSFKNRKFLTFFLIWFASSFFPALDLLSVHKSEWILDFIILVDFKVLLPKSQAFVWSVESYIFLSIPSVVDSRHRRWFV